MALTEEEKQRIKESEQLRQAIQAELRPQSPKKKDFLGKADHLFSTVKNIVLSIGIIAVGLLMFIYVLPQLDTFFANSKVEKVQTFGISVVANEKMENIIPNEGSKYTPVLLEDAYKPISLDGVRGQDRTEYKGPIEDLPELARDVRSEYPSGIDVMVIKSGKRYRPDYLQEYLRELGVKYVLFEDKDGSDPADIPFDGWVEAHKFSNYINKFNKPNGAPRILEYEELRELVGIHDAHIRSNGTAMEALQLMKAERLEYVAVLDASGNFRYMISQGDLLTEVVSAALFKSAKQEDASTVNV